MQDPLPDLPSHFRQVRFLAKGSMGCVYEAWDASSQGPVAIKVLSIRDADRRESLEREIRLLGSLRHEGVVHLLEAGVSGGDLYLAMELVHGVALSAFLQRPLPDLAEIHWILSVATRILGALDFVHAQSWIHGDLKPSNVLVVVPPDVPASAEAALAVEDPPVKLLDFGLAKEADSTTGSAEGTPLYMPPEAFADRARLDGRADLYSLGALLYHLVTRRPPFESLTQVRLRPSEPASPRTRNPACPSALSDLILRLLEKDPHRRFESAAAARQALVGLREHTGEPRQLLPPTFVGRSPELTRLRAHLAAAAGGQGRCIRVAGERGSGKTWLLERSGLPSQAVVDLGMARARGTFRRAGPVRQALRDVFRELLRILGARRGAEEAARAFHPWGEVLGQALGLDLDPEQGEDAHPPPPATASRSEALWRDPLRGSDPPPPAEGPGGPARLLREHLFQASQQILRAAASAGPVLVVLEDLQHADELELELLAHVAATIEALPVALIVTYRPEAVRDASAPSRFLAEVAEAGAPDPVILGGLGDGEARELVEGMLRPAARASTALLQFLSRDSEGKPLALIRRLQALWARMDIVLEDGEWTLRRGAESAAGMGPWHDRLRTLDHDELLAVAGAAVLEGPFEEPVLGRVLEGRLHSARPGAGLASHLVGWPDRVASLVRRGFLAQDEDGLAAPPDLDEGALGPFVPEEELRRLHARAGAVLTEWYGAGAESHALHIAEHFLRAGDRARALDLLIVAGRAAARVYANQRAADAYAKALELCDDAEVKRGIAEELGELHTRMGSYPVALECFGLAESLRRSAAKDAAGEQVAAAQLDILDKIGRVLHRQGEFGEALTVFSRCLEGATGRPDARARALFRIGGIHLDRGDPSTAARYLEESLAIYREVGDFRQMAAAQSGLGVAEKSLNHLEAAVARFEEALANAEKAGNLLDVATTLNNLGNIHRARGDDRAAVACLRRSIEARKRAGDRQGLAICLNNIARVHAFRGDLAQARKATEEALGIFEDIGDKKGIAIARSNLGEMAHLQGEFRTAEDLFAGNLELAGRLRVPRLLETNLCNLAELELDRGAYQLAADLLRRCLRALPEGRPIELRAQALGALGAALLGLRNMEEAEDAMREAVELAVELKLGEKLGVILGHRVRLLVEKGDPDGAVRAGRPFLHGATDSYGAARLCREMGRAYRELGPDWADMTEKNLMTALRTFDRMGSPHNSALTEIELGIYWRLQGEDEEAARLFVRAEETLRRLDLPRRLEELAAARSMS